MFADRVSEENDGANANSFGNEALDGQRPVLRDIGPGLMTAGNNESRQRTTRFGSDEPREIQTVLSHQLIIDDNHCVLIQVGKRLGSEIDFYLEINPEASRYSSGEPSEIRIVVDEKHSRGFDRGVHEKPVCRS